MVVLRHRRGVVAAAAVVAFNLLMFVLAAMGSSPMEAPFLVAWITGDAVLSVAALFHRTPVAGNQRVTRYIHEHSRTTASCASTGRILPGR
jgi:hypothetical protein